MSPRTLPARPPAEPGAWRVRTRLRGPRRGNMGRATVPSAGSLWVETRRRPDPSRAPRRK
ncbi:hypothetical protein FTUN_2382 [Frigoriglobus tundricola]|uniref:Uncharacterized protein n=1 Tax=Frigoriglobus tundricola TaxID=2774151 RepID=A0A6M5YNE2_9BACT|nr:hypothetical protein FTUN_2382 [Frigoriglobus tundricola]